MSPSTSIHGMWSTRPACSDGPLDRLRRLAAHDFTRTAISPQPPRGTGVFEAPGRV